MELKGPEIFLETLYLLIELNLISLELSSNIYLYYLSRVENFSYKSS